MVKVISTNFLIKLNSIIQLIHIFDCVDLNFKHTFGQRQTNFLRIKSRKDEIGNKILANRISILGNKINVEDLNVSLKSFKIKYSV